MVEFIEKEMGGGSGGNYDVDAVYYSTCSTRASSPVAGGWKNLEMGGETIGRKIWGWEKHENFGMGERKHKILK